MELPTAVEHAPSSRVDLNTGVNHTVLPPTNGVTEIEAIHNNLPIDDVATSNDHTDEQPNGDKLGCKKRDIPEPPEEDEREPKKVKLSPEVCSGDGHDLATNIAPSPEVLANTFSKDAWQGFCEIESEPAYFSAILQDMGVQGVNVREVFAPDPEFLETLPQPIYGLILLYRYRELGAFDGSTDNPDDVWFANQLPAQNSCATLAMINILMNCADVHIGEHLNQFKDFTKEFTPYQRGEAFASFDFVKKTHNSFAKTMDILEADKHLSHKVNKSQRQLKDKKARRKSTDSAATDDSAGYEHNAHHFIAFIPVGNKVWKLDGLDARPTSMATFDTARGETWLSTVTELISTITAAGDEDYGMIAIAQSPLPSLRKQAYLAINTMRHAESRLNEITTDWKPFITDDSSLPQLQALDIEDQLARHPVSDTLAATIAGEQMSELIDRRNRVAKDLNQLTANIITEMQNEAEDNQKAAQRRYDCGPVIKVWAQMLASNGYLEGNLDRFMSTTARDKKAKK
ncbi:hypothetical protein N0V94_008884 [Neodidymelliopsis sp. IMI 364377]|nr:hypothetical protein N0V94_008884 [Neodidymelliopsis sp. IMI 364377]